MHNGIYEIYDRLNPPAEEAYRILRTNIQFCCSDKNIRSLAIVSCNEKEGKTTTSINLSISLARSGLKVLLVDADLRKPMRIKRLGGRSSEGLSNYLQGTARLEDIISYTSINNLSYISCGPKPPNPSELIHSNRFSTFLQIMKEEYDAVIIDTSTLSSVIDGAMIASQADGTLIVMASRAVQAYKAKRLKEQLENVNANILGVVLNKVSKRDYKVYNNYKNNFYFYSDDAKKDKAKKVKPNNSNKNEVPFHD